MKDRQTSDRAKWGPAGVWPSQVAWVMLSSTFASGDYLGPAPE